MFKRLVVLILFMSFVFPLHARDIRLSNNYVTSMAIDSAKNIWVGTEEGLNCFDGLNTVIYEKHNSLFDEDEINFVFADKFNPFIWVALRHGGLARIDILTKEIVIYKHDPNNPESLVNDDISHIAQDEKGNIWASSFSRGIDRLDLDTGSFTHYMPGDTPGFMNYPVHTFLIWKDRLYLGHWDKGISIINLKDGSFMHFRHRDDDPASLLSDSIRSLYLDPSNNLWVGTRRGLSMISELASTFTNFKHDDGNPYSIPEGSVYDIRPLSDSVLYVATDKGGVAEIDLKAGSYGAKSLIFKTLVSDNNPVSVPARAVALDSFGNIWIGSYGYGLLFRSGQNDGTNIIRYNAGSQSNLMTCIASDEYGNVIIGTRSGQVLRASNGITGKLAVSETDGRPITAILKDKEGHLWTGHSDNIVTVMNPDGTKQNLTIPGAGAGDLLTLADDGDYIWAGTSSGVHRIDKANKCVVGSYGRDYGIKDGRIKSIARDIKGRLWVGTYGRGAYIFDSEMNLSGTISTSNRSYSNSVNNIISAKDGKMWLASGEGLISYDTGTDSVLHIYTVNDGLRNDNIKALAEDLSGNIWMSTNIGVSCLSLDGNIVNFDYRDHIPGGSYTAGSVALSSKGTIYFGSTEGIAQIDPEIALMHKDLPCVEILNIPDYISVDYKDNHISVDFCVPDYKYADNVDYEYRFSNLNPEWRQCGTSLSFDHMQYGRHNLEIRAKLTTQDWDNDISKLTINVEPPIWGTTMAYIIYMALLLLLVTSVARYIVIKSKQAAKEKFQRDILIRNQEINDERMKFFTNITHELRTPLTLILGPLDDIYKDNGIPGEIRRKISIVRNSSYQLLNLINQLLDFRKTESSNRRFAVCFGNISSFLERIGERFINAADKRDVSYFLEIEPDINMYFDPDIITSILDNLLSNAKKYTEKGFIELSLKRIEANKVVLSVTDSGAGIQKDELEKIFERYYQVKRTDYAYGTGIGLSIVKSLCELHKFEITVDSQVGKGSCFSIIMDAGNEYSDAIHIDYPKPVEDIVEDEINDCATQRTSILVVEDNSGICDYIKESLSGSYTVRTAENGKEGLRMALREIPDVLISDVMMPVMDGIDLCKAIKNDIRTSHIPVILLTAKSSDEDRKTGYDVGADSYLVKPFNREIILSRIENILKTRRRLAALISNGEQPAEMSKIDNEFIRSFTELVEKNISNDEFDLSNVASSLCMSQSTLYRKIKAVTGLSPIENVKLIKLNKAATLLKDTDLTISEICWQVGMGSPVYFRDCFKARFGQTPSAFRNEEKNKQS